MSLIKYSRELLFVTVFALTFPPTYPKAKFRKIF